MNHINEYNDFINEEFGKGSLITILTSLIMTFGNLNNPINKIDNKIEYSIQMADREVDEQTSNLYSRIMWFVKQGVNNREKILNFVQEIKDLMFDKEIEEESLSNALNSIENNNIQGMMKYHKLLQTKINFTHSDKKYWPGTPFRNKFNKENQKENGVLLFCVAIIGLLYIIIKPHKHQNH